MLLMVNLSFINNIRWYSAVHVTIRSAIVKNPIAARNFVALCLTEPE